MMIPIIPLGDTLIVPTCHQKIGTQWKWKSTPMETSSMESITVMHLEKLMTKLFSRIIISLAHGFQMDSFTATHFPMSVADRMMALEFFEYAILNGSKESRQRPQQPLQRQQRP